MSPIPFLRFLRLLRFPLPFLPEPQNTEPLNPYSPPLKQTGT